MFSFFRRGKSAGKNDGGASAAEKNRTPPNDRNNCATSVRRDQRSEVASDDSPKHATLTRKDVVNLLIPSTDYNTHKSGVGGIFQNIMAGNRRQNRNKQKNRHKNKNGISRAESYKEISTDIPEEMQSKGVNLYRSHSQLDKTFSGGDSHVSHEALSAPVSASDLTYEVIPATDSKNNCANETRAPAAAHANDAPPDPASFVKELVLQKYKNKSPVQPKRQHVSLVYVSSEPAAPQYPRVTLVDRDAERQHAEALLKEIAKRIDCELNEKLEPMGASDSKNDEERRPYEYKTRVEPKPENEAPQTNSMTAFKDDLKNELEKLLQNEAKADLEVKETIITEQPQEDTEATEDDDFQKLTADLEEIKSNESPGCIKKSNLKPPRSDTEGCSDDDRSDCGKKKVTFRKTIDFDDGDQQTDDEVDSSFESLASSEAEDEEESEEEDEALPDNDELLGGVVVARSDDKTSQDELSLPTVIAQLNESNDLNVKELCKSSELETIRTNDKQDLKTSAIKESIDNEPLSASNNPGGEKYDSDKDETQRLNSDNSDSGFLEISEKVGDKVKVTNESETESETEEEVTDSEVESEEEIVAEIIEPEDFSKHNPKSLVAQEDKYQSQVVQLSELANSRSGEAERARELLAGHRKEIEARVNEIERLKCELAAAYKESELIRQRGRSLEEELHAARSCSAQLAGKLGTCEDVAERALRSELETAHARIAELEARVAALERERARLELERRAQEQRAQEAVAAAEASSARWRAAHEATRSQAAARAERLLDDCEWKMRELERRARDAEKRNVELTSALKNTETKPASAELEAELKQLRGQSSEQQRSLQALAAQLQRLESREEALKLEVHRLKELLEKEAQLAKDKEERHRQSVSRLEATHAARVETVRAELHAQHAAARGHAERAHAERTRAALAQLRAEHERDARNHERKMRETLTRFENLKEVLASKEAQFEETIAEARSKSDWDVMQLRHMLDKADITYANNVEKATERHEAECERLNKEWSEKLSAAEEAAESAAGEAAKLLEATRVSLEAERRDQVNRLKELHRKEMNAQWEQFMIDKEECLARMKLECRQEGEEEMTRREKDMLDEIADLKAQIASKSSNFDDLASKAAACGRTLAVTEQELREALEREKELRSQRSEDADRIKRARGEARDEVDHLTRKCACLRKLFDDMRTKLAAREKTSAEESRTQQREIQKLKAEVARLTKILVEQNTPSLGARTRADGCDCAPPAEAESFFCEAGPQACESQQSAPRRKGGTLRTPELQRRRPNAPEPLRPLDLTALKPLSRDGAPGRRRAKSVDLPAVQVPCRIKQLEDMNK